MQRLEGLLSIFGLFAQLWIIYAFVDNHKNCGFFDPRLTISGELTGLSEFVDNVHHGLFMQLLTIYTLVDNYCNCKVIL